ncbi:MAG: hypothetical protein R3B06_01590 [Kofleriaceae bacterium]
MSRWSLVVVVVSTLAGCGSSKPAAPPDQAGTPPAATGSAPGPAQAPKGTMRTYALDTDGDPPASVTLAIPAGWAEDALSTPTQPSWKLAGALQLSLAAIAPRGDDDATRTAKAIKMQYGDAAGAERSDLSGGRVWMVVHEGDNLHARMFVPVGTAVVMGVAILGPDGASALPSIKQVFETIQAAPAP